MIETLYRVRKIYYMIIFIIGVHVNLMAIVILSRGKCGLSTCTTRYLVAMATADLLTIIFDVLLWRVSYYYFPGTFLDITPVCSAVGALGVAATDCSVWFTVMFTFDRFVVICCHKLKTKYCIGKTAAVVLTTTAVLMCIKNVPYCFRFRPAKVVDNIPWDCISKADHYTDPGWVGISLSLIREKEAPPFHSERKDITNISLVYDVGNPLRHFIRSPCQNIPKLSVLRAHNRRSSDSPDDTRISCRDTDLRSALFQSPEIVNHQKRAEHRLVVKRQERVPYPQRTVINV
ncbi:uncharacterized protein LOC132387905 [Hypanus sabinus]|uniref:uncharacterized protein LOC132387905 n=1 Tax=Hypanus sabinus TaxID=79690 RepID=UPI0028C4A29C|nr:uncharacterized protein LOC132387905 [Hypanus sabinus]